MELDVCKNENEVIGESVTSFLFLQTFINHPDAAT